MDDASIIQRVQEGDSDAFGGLMDLYAGRVRGIIALWAPAPHLIDELAHETFVFAFISIQEFRRGTSFAGWLGSIARNLVRREVLRFSRERENRLRYAASRDQTAASARPSEGRDILERLFRRVAPETKELLELRYCASLPTQEIARRIGRTDTWVRTALWRIRRKLRDSVAIEMR
jgi:RNA polymerase sigma-70 factor (ECF subfamily)